MIIKIIDNFDDNLYKFINEVNNNEIITNLECYVGYSNFFSMWKIIDIFKETKTNVNIIFCYSKDISSDFTLKDNFLYNENNFYFLDNIPYEIYNSITSFLDFQKIENKLIKIKIRRIESKKALKNIEKIFHGKLYKIDTKTNSYLIIGSSNLTYTGLGITSSNYETNFCNEVNCVLNDKNNEYYKKWIKKFNESFKLDSSKNLLLDNYSSIHLKDVLKYLFNKQNSLDIQLYDFLAEFKEKSPIRRSLKDYQSETLEKIICAMLSFGGAVLNYDVGLGKTHIGLAIYDLFKNFLNEKNVKILVPPGLKDEWINYSNVKEFSQNLKHLNIDVISQTKEKELEYLSNANVLIIDEAHNYRRLNTERRFRLIKNFFDDNYKKKDGNCFNRNGKMVLLITATPFNNDCQEVQNLIDLFGNNKRGYRKGFEQINELWENRDSLFSHKNITESNEDLIKFIFFFFNRLNKNFNRYDEKQPNKKYYFPKISHLGEKNLNPIIVDDYEFIEKYGIQKINNFNKIFDELYNKIKYIAKNELFTIDAKDLIINNLLISLDSSIDAFKDSVLKIINRIRYNIELFAKDDEYEHKYNAKYFKNNDDIDDIENDDIDGIKDVTNFGKDDYFYPKKFIERFINNPKLTNELDELEIWIKKECSSEIINENMNIKFEYLVHLLNNIDGIEKRKAIIFCSRVKTVDFLSKSLANKYLKNDNDAIIGATSNSIKIYTKNNKYTLEGVDIKELKNIAKCLFSPICNNQLSNNKSKQIYEQYKHFNFNLLISTNVFAEGHNLQDATVVINYDNHFNPMVIMQRIGRVDRFRDYDNEYKDEIYKTIYVFNIWTNSKIVNESMYIANKQKTWLADVLGSDTHKFYIDYQYALEYSKKQDNHFTKQQQAFKNQNFLDEILVYKFKEYENWSKASYEIEKNHPQYLIFNTQDNALFILIKTNDEYIGIFVNSQYEIMINTEDIFSYWNNDTLSIENNIIHKNQKYLDWLKIIKDNNLLSNQILKKIKNKNFEIIKIIYFIKEE